MSAVNVEELKLLLVKNKGAIQTIKGIEKLLLTKELVYPGNLEEFIQGRHMQEIKQLRKEKQRKAKSARKANHYKKSNYYANNKEAIAKNYQNNKKAISAQQANYYKNNKKAISAQKANYYKKQKLAKGQVFHRNVQTFLGQHPELQQSLRQGLISHVTSVAAFDKIQASKGLSCPQTMRQSGKQVNKVWFFVGGKLIENLFAGAQHMSSHHKYNGDLVFLVLKPECFSQYTFNNFNNGKDYRACWVEQELSGVMNLDHFRVIITRNFGQEASCGLKPPVVPGSTSPYIAGQVFVDLRGLEEAPDGLADDFGPAKLPDSVQDRYLDDVQAQGMVETMLKEQNVDPEDAVAWARSQKQSYTLKKVAAEVQAKAKRQRDPSGPCADLDPKRAKGVPARASMPHAQVLG